MAIDTTRQLIQQIKNATQIGENTAARVGGAMEAILGDVTDVNTNSSVFSLFGSNLQQNGAVGAIADFCVTPFIQVEEGEVVKVGGYSGGTSFTNYSLLCTYNSDGAFVAHYGDDGSSGFKEYSLTIPSGVAYIRVGSRNDTANALYISRSYVRCRLLYKLLVSVNEFTSTLPDVEAKQKAILHDLSAGLFKNPGYVRGSDGVYVANANYKCTDFLPIDGMPIVARGANVTTSNIYLCTFYNSNKAFVGVLSGTATSSDIEATITAASIPNNAAYFRINVRVSYEDNAYLLCGLVPSMLARLDALSNINTVTVNAMGETIPGKVINTLTGAETTLSSTTYPNQICTGFIAVTPGQKLKISGKFGSSVGFAGYDATKAWNKNLVASGSSPVYPGTASADKMEITIPSDVYYVRGSSTDNVSNPLEVFAASDIQTAFDNVNAKLATVVRNDKIVIEKISTTTFDVSIPQLSTGKYLVHRFNYIKFTKTLNYGNGMTKSVVCSDIWNPSFIMYGGNNVIQGNLNFIYMVADSLTSDPTSEYYNENSHVGQGHGGEIKEYQRFFADGIEFDPTQLTEPLECSVFSAVCKANCYAIDTTQPGFLSAQATLKLDNNGDPILTAVHTYIAEYRPDNVIKWDNNLLIKRNGLKFQQCHGSMCQGWYPYFNNVVLATPTYDNNDYNLSSGAVFTPIGSSVNLNTYRYQAGGEVVLNGAHYQIRHKMTQQGDRFDKCYLMVQPYTDDPRLKIYLQPVKTQVQFGASGAETFNDGDLLSVHVERAIEFNV